MTDLDRFRRWQAGLRHFRIVPALGGHANDGDRVEVALRYQGPDDLTRLLTALGIEPVTYPERPSQPVPGRPYRPEEMAAFPALVPGTTWTRQPGHQRIGEAPVFVWCDGERCELSIVSAADGGYSIDDEAVGRARALEPLIDALADRVVAPRRALPM